MTGSLPYTGYVSGQEIPLSLDIDNNSDVEFESIHIELKKVCIKIVCFIFWVHIISQNICAIV